MPDEAKNPFDQALDLVLYAPLGLVLTARETLPELAVKGRQRLTSQMAMARMIGKFAVGEGEKEARRRIDQLAQTLAGVVLPAEARPADGGTPAPGDPLGGGSGERPGGNGRAQNLGGAPGGPGSAMPAPSRSKAALAITGYDTLSASQVVQRLAGLAADELEAVRQYEGQTRGRRTILSKIAQLQTGSTT